MLTAYRTLNRLLLVYVERLEMTLWSSPILVDS